jgi:hypothetical protein
LTAPEPDPRRTGSAGEPTGDTLSLLSPRLPAVERHRSRRPSAASRSTRNTPDTGLRRLRALDRGAQLGGSGRRLLRLSHPLCALSRSAPGGRCGYGAVPLGGPRRTEAGLVAGRLQRFPGPASRSPLAGGTRPRQWDLRGVPLLLLRGVPVDGLPAGTVASHVRASSVARPTLGRTPECDPIRLQLHGDPRAKRP